MRSAVVVAFVVLLAAACGGSIAPVPGSSGSSGSSGASSGGTSGGTSGGSSGGASGGLDCSSPVMTSMFVNRVCVPATAPAGAPLTLAIDGPSCVPCFSTESCRVKVSGTMIQVSMTTSTCTPPGDSSCDDICQIPAATCTIPPLEEGIYTVSLDTGGSRTLLVGANGGQASCKLKQPGLPPDPFDVSEWIGGCNVDTDCEAVVSGYVCDACACPSGAILASSDAAYRTAFSAAQSQCPLDAEEPPCAPCVQPKVICSRPPKLAGTCRLQQ